MNSPPATVPEQDTLIGWGARFVNALLDAADPDALGRRYWDRARSALERAAAATSFPEAVSRGAAKLEVHGALTGRALAVIGELSEHLSSPAVFAAWSSECARDAVYITAVARIDRDGRKAGEAAS